MNSLIWPVLIYGGISVLLVVAMVVISYLLGERHASKERDDPYESGIIPTGSGHLRYNARYYLIGLFFILFDVEAVIIFAWAVAFRELGWSGYIGAALFIVTLAVGLVYIWREGGLDWNSTPNNPKSQIPNPKSTGGLE